MAQKQGAAAVDFVGLVTLTFLFNDLSSICCHRAVMCAGVGR